MSKKFLTDAILQSAEMPASSAGQLAGDIVAAIKAEIIETGRFTIPDFGAFVVRETPKRTALNGTAAKLGVSCCRSAVPPTPASLLGALGNAFSLPTAFSKRPSPRDPQLRGSPWGHSRPAANFATQPLLPRLS